MNTCILNDETPPPVSLTCLLPSRQEISAMGIFNQTKRKDLRTLTFPKLVVIRGKASSLKEKIQNK